MGTDHRTFNARYCQRVKDLREIANLTQEEMARALGIPLDRYKKYEVRSPLPAYLLEQFALTVHRDIAFVVTGKSAEARRGPRKINYPPGPEETPKRGRRWSA